MRHLPISLIIIAVGTCASERVRAQWLAKVDGPDVFGATSVAAAVNGNEFGQSLIVQCDDTGKLYLALLLKKLSADTINNLPASIFFKFDEGATMKLSAETRDWNENYAGVVVEGRSPESLAVINAIRDARTPIQVGAKLNEAQISGSFSVLGSASAMD